jgi:hypothetical protein
MKTPLLTTSTDFYEELSAYYGMYGRLTHPRIEDILKRAFDINALYDIFHGKVHVDVERVTHQDNVIQIPEQSLQGAATVYLVDSATWIMFLQSNVNRSEAYAWQIPVMDYYPAYPTTYRITPFNPTLYQEGWRINADVDDELGTYISMHSKPLLKRTHDSQLVTNPTTWQATQRPLTATTTYQQYQLPPSTADIVDEFMKFWETKQC